MAPQVPLSAVFQTRRSAMTEVWVNGQFGGQIDGRDAGFRVGFGVFETLGVFAGAIPLWDAHIARLRSNAAALGIPCSLPDDLEQVAAELLARNEAASGAVQDVLRVTLTGGLDGVATWCVATRNRGPAEAVRLYPVVFAPPTTAAIKTTSRACYVAPLRAATAQGASEALLIDATGHALETTTGNVFVSCDGRWLTPPLDGRILPGVARGALIRALGQEGVPLLETGIDQTKLRTCDALFVTNAAWGPRPAVLLGDDRGVAELDSRIAAAWQRAIS